MMSKYHASFTTHMIEYVTHTWHTHDWICHTHMTHTWLNMSHTHDTHMIEMTHHVSCHRARRDIICLYVSMSLCLYVSMSLCLYLCLYVSMYRMIDQDSTACVSYHTHERRVMTHDCICHKSILLCIPFSYQIAHKSIQSKPFHHAISNIGACHVSPSIQHLRSLQPAIS
jgi:hypothetical protein